MRVQYPNCRTIKGVGHNVHIVQCESLYPSSWPEAWDYLPLDFSSKEPARSPYPLFRIWITVKFAETFEVEVCSADSSVKGTCVSRFSREKRTLVVGLFWVQYFTNTSFSKQYRFKGSMKFLKKKLSFRRAGIMQNDHLKILKVVVGHLGMRAGKGYTEIWQNHHWVRLEGMFGHLWVWRRAGDWGLKELSQHVSIGEVIQVWERVSARKEGKEKQKEGWEGKVRSERE